MPNAPKLITKEKGLFFLSKAMDGASGSDADVLEVAIADLRKQDFDFFEVEVKDSGCSFTPVSKENINE